MRRRRAPLGSIRLLLNSAETSAARGALFPVEGLEGASLEVGELVGSEGSVKGSLGKLGVSRLVGLSVGRCCSPCSFLERAPFFGSKPIHPLFTIEFESLFR